MASHCGRQGSIRGQSMWGFRGQSVTETGLSPDNYHSISLPYSFIYYRGCGYWGHLWTRFHKAGTPRSKNKKGEKRSLSV
jgi:hypothetical protein